jgi:hypothetical protein
MAIKPENSKTDRHDPTGMMQISDPRGLRIDGYFGPGLLRRGVGKLVQRTGEAQFCGSLVYRVFGYEEGPHKIDKNKISRRYEGEFMGITFEGKKIYASSGYLPSPVERSSKAMIDRGVTVSFTGDLWCEPAENTPLGYAFRPYDLRPRGADDTLTQLAIEAGIIAPLALPAPAPAPVADDAEIDPETGEIAERLSDAAQ